MILWGDLDSRNLKHHDILNFSVNKLICQEISLNLADGFIIS